MSPNTLVAVHGIRRDITEQTEANERIRTLAFFDPLTGLANRSLFRNMVKHRLIHGAGRGTRCAVLVVDVDRFKLINETLGSQIGDEVLKVTKPCSGCMYGSFPEMTLSMRYLKAKMERIKTFITSPPPKKWPVTYEQMLILAERIRNEKRERIALPSQQHRLTLDAGSEQETAKLV